MKPIHNVKLRKRTVCILEHGGKYLGGEMAPLALPPSPPFTSEPPCPLQAPPGSVRHRTRPAAATRLGSTAKPAPGPRPRRVRAVAPRPHKAGAAAAPAPLVADRAKRRGTVGFGSEGGGGSFW